MSLNWNAIYFAAILTFMYMYFLLVKQRNFDVKKSYIHRENNIVMYVHCKLNYVKIHEKKNNNLKLYTFFNDLI